MVGYEDIQILDANVMHHRTMPKINRFFYRIFYFCVPFSRLDKKSGNFLLGFNRHGLFTINASDHGNKNNQSMQDWVSNALANAGLKDIDLSKIKLITLPRVMGYIFNPVSFWICTNQNGELRAVICEVNNTFGEHHSYICFHEGGQAISPQDVLGADKMFHVSPFLKREGGYEFRFSQKKDSFAAFIDFFNQNSQKMLLTSLSGELTQVTTGKLIWAFFRYPLVTLQVIFLIHYQAIKIILKGIAYVPKPIQMDKNISISTPKNLNSKET